MSAVFCSPECKHSHFINERWFYYSGEGQGLSSPTMPDPAFCPAKNCGLRLNPDGTVTERVDKSVALKALMSCGLPLRAWLPMTEEIAEGKLAWAEREGREKP